MPSAKDIVDVITALQGFAEKDPFLCFWLMTMFGLPPILAHIRWRMDKDD